MTVSTLGHKDSGGWPVQSREEIKAAVQQQVEEQKERKSSLADSLYGPQLLAQNENARARRQAEMDQLLTQLEGSLKKKSKSFHKRAYSSDRVMAMPKEE